jgi:hypothetical protein
MLVDAAALEAATKRDRASRPRPLIFDISEVVKVLDFGLAKVAAG